MLEPMENLKCLAKYAIILYVTRCNRTIWRQNMKKKTAVSIVSSKEQAKKEVVKIDKKGGGTEKKEKKPLSEKMVKLIDELALLSLEENATYSDVVGMYTELRSGYAKEQRGDTRPQEEDDEIEFRKKANRFFSNVEFRPEHSENYIARRCLFDFGNFHSEAACAIYKLIKEENNLNRENIFKKAMPFLEFNPDVKAIARARETNISYVLAYFNELVKHMCPDEMRRKDGSAEFLNQFTYRENEKVMLLVIFLIQNQ